MDKPYVPLHVLVVEDDWLVRLFIVGELRDKGHVVLEAATGEEAIALLRAEREEPIEVLFTDIQLGGELTGWDVAEVFREANPKLPVLYASGRGRDTHREVPGSVFFPKPYLPGDVLKAIDDAPIA